jgi:hypothetical protein
LDQDGAPADELEKNMQQIIRSCYLVVTPVVDETHADWDYVMDANGELPSDGGWLAAYQSASWLDYLSRGWCRVEMMIGAVSPSTTFPVDDHESKGLHFRGGVRGALLAGRRPHIIFGTKEDNPKNGHGLLLPPLTHSIFEKYQPGDGMLTNEIDKTVIRTLELVAHEQWPD